MGPNIKIKKCNYNLHDGRIGGCGAWDARGCWMWSMPEGRQCEPRELAKGPESAIGQVRQYRGKFQQMVPDNMSCVSVEFGGGGSEQLQLTKRRLRES